MQQLLSETLPVFCCIIGLSACAPCAACTIGTGCSGSSGSCKVRTFSLAGALQELSESAMQTGTCPGDNGMYQRPSLPDNNLHRPVSPKNHQGFHKKLVLRLMRTCSQWKANLMGMHAHLMALPKFTAAVPTMLVTTRAQRDQTDSTLTFTQLVQAGVCTKEHKLICFLSQLHHCSSGKCKIKCAG